MRRVYTWIPWSWSGAVKLYLAGETGSFKFNIMAGVYLHIPYCRKACHYCNFHFSTSLQTKNEFVEALLKEIEWRKDYIAGQPIDTIYFGGGTPSLLEIDELEKITGKLRSHYLVSDAAEITLEANPDDITGEKVRNWKSLGINRLSMGIQSFYEEDLQWMNRAHDASQALNCIDLAQNNGIDNITIDLIYGTPTLSDEKWEANLDRAIALGIPHLSCYALTVEPRTALDALIRKKKLEDVDPEKQAGQFTMLMEKMDDSGFEHYEISNFAKPGYRSRHNSAYWSGAHYLGLGPSAHSFNGVSRQWNLANNALYISAMKNEQPAEEMELLTLAQQANEYIMTALRTMEGLDLAVFEERFGLKWREEIEKNVDRYIKSGKVELRAQHLVLSRAGKLFADGIAADLFIS